MSAVLEVNGVGKVYQNGNSRLSVLKGITFEVEHGGACAIVGPSGSGKTTLLGLCAGLDQPTSGTIIIDGHELSALSEDERARIRNDKVGFVFQNFQLLPTLTALENVMVPLELRGQKKIAGKASELLNRVGLGERLNHYPAQLSGGEQQRVALARAFINEPKILFADEPTGNLDDETSGRIVELLFDLNQSAGTALVLVTHNLDLARRTGRVISLKGGLVAQDQTIPLE